jgi:hypothetical protein
MAIITTQITVTEAQLPLIQDAATEAGKSPAEFLGDVIKNGQSLQQICNDRANQAFWRLNQSGEIPKEIFAESRRQAEASAASKALPKAPPVQVVA